MRNELIDYDIIGAIEEHGYMILNRLDRKAFDLYMANQGYTLFIDGLARQDIELKVSIYEDSLAERPFEGVFHTDFSSHENPPDYVVVECIKPDPKYPKYGYNQIVSVEKLINELKSYDVRLFDRFKDLIFSFSVRNKVISYAPLFLDEQGRYYMKYHPAYINNYNSLDERYFYKGLRIIDFIEELALSLCDDILLNANQSFITSNKYCLHRRGRCTVDIKNQNNNRVINTFRYIKS